MSDSIIEFFENRLYSIRNKEQAEKMTKYMRNIQPYLGIPTPERKEVYKEFKKTLGGSLKNTITHNALEGIVKELYYKPEREFRYVALFLIEYFGNLSLDQLDLFRELIISGEWWDTTDSIAIELISPLLKQNKGVMTPIMKKWVFDENMWIRRTAILSQLYYKQDTDVELLEYCITQTMGETEFFIQKAIGWSLREYSKTDPQFVSSFIDTLNSQLSKLSVREGMKHIKKSSNRHT